MRSGLLAALLLAPATVFAEPVCGDRGAIVHHLEQRYQERPSGLGLMPDGNLIEILVSSSGTWTLLVSRPDGASCAVAAGDHWQSAVPAGKPETGAGLEG